MKWLHDEDLLEAFHIRERCKSCLKDLLSLLHNLDVIYESHLTKDLTVTVYPRA